MISLILSKKEDLKLIKLDHRWILTIQIAIFDFQITNNNQMTLNKLKKVPIIHIMNIDIKKIQGMSSFLKK